MPFSVTLFAHIQIYTYSRYVSLGLIINSKVNNSVFGNSTVLAYLKDVLESLLTLPPVVMQCLIIVLDESILGYLY